jgi:dethiobiotin synthetase
MAAWFVTATGTDVGKTFVTRGLIGHLRQRGQRIAAIKPVVSGFSDDTAATSDPGLLLQALGQPVNDDTLNRIAPWRFKAPLSPDMAAAREHRKVPFAALVAHTQAAIHDAVDGLLFIEGVGGIMVPLDERYTVLNWMSTVKLPVILVAGSYLGTISHTLSALDVLHRRSLLVGAVVISETAGSPVPLAETVSAIARFANPVKVLGISRTAGPDPDPAAFGELAAALL